jgi:hypothetical protein
MGFRDAAIRGTVDVGFRYGGCPEFARFFQPWA